MIQAKELRIGNFIKSKYGDGILELQDITVKGYSAEWIDYDNYEPIPLTEEWLLKFGFVKKYPKGWVASGEDYFQFKEFLICSRKQFNSFCWEWKKPFTTSSITVTDFKYVHELQNLVFALTGEELSK